MQSYSLDPKCSLTIPYPRLSQTGDGQHALSAICGLSLSLFPPSVMKECPGSGLSPSSAVARLFVVRAWVAGGFRLTQQASQTNLMQTQVQIFSTYRMWTCLKSSIITPGLNTHQLMRVSKVAASLQMSMMKSHENIMCSTDFNQKSKLSERSVCKASFHGMACRRSKNSWPSHRDFKLAGICCEAMYSNLMTHLLPMKWVEG